MTPTLGQPLTFTHALHRTIAGTDPARPLRKVWEPRPASWHVPRTTTLHGIIIGIRTLADGEFATAGGPYDPPEEVFISTDHYTAYLVAYDLRRKPVYVLPEHATLEEHQ